MVFVVMLVLLLAISAALVLTFVRRALTESFRLEISVLLVAMSVLLVAISAALVAISDLLMAISAALLAISVLLVAISALFCAIASKIGLIEIPPLTRVNFIESPTKVIDCNSLVRLVSLSNRLILDTSAYCA